MNETTISAIRFALDIALKATLLFSIASLAIGLLRRSGAAARHLAGTAGLIGALALPLLTLALPRWEIGVLPSPFPSPAIEVSSSAVPVTERFDLAPGPPSEAATDNARETVSSVTPLESRGQRVPWPLLALALWAAGVLLVGGRLAFGMLRVRNIGRKAAPILDREWTEETRRLSRELEVSRPVELLESARVPVAMTSGLLRPMLLLCRQAHLWEVDRRRVVLLHELAHVRRADWLWLLLAEAALAFYWWHPLAWVLARQVRRDCERACDDLVLAAGTKPSVYAGHLLGIFRSLSVAAHPVAPAAASERPSHFEGRLRAILDPNGPRRELPRMRAALAAAGLIGAAAFLSAVAPWAPACSDAAVLAPISQLAGEAKPDENAASAAAPETCQRAGPTAAEAAHAARASTGDSPSASPSPTIADPDADSDLLPESGRTLPAILKSLEKVKEAGFVRASKRFAKAGRRDGSDWYGKAMDLHHDGRYDEAIAAFEKAIEAGYREDAASYNIACGYARKGDRDKAFEWLRRAMDAGFDLERYLGHDDDLDGLKPDPRWRELKKQVSEQPSARREREAAAAVARYERLVAKAPKDGEPFYNIGKDLLNAGRYDLSAKAFAESAARGYRAGASLYNQACALSRGGQTRAALDLLQRALDAGFDQPRLFERDDDLDNVRDDPRFAQLAKEARELSLPGRGIGDWFERSSERRAKWREAARRFEEYARANPQKGRAWFNLGFASLAAEHPEAAAEAFRKALELDYRKPTTMYNLACTYARMDQKDAAFDWLFKALDAGFDATGTLRGDEDLDNLRGDPRFRKALAIARAREKSRED